MHRKKKKSKSHRHPKAFDAIKKALVDHLFSQNYEPSTEAELFSSLALQEEAIPLAKKILTSLLMEGMVSLKKKLFVPKKVHSPSCVSGILRMHPRGFGFVIPQDPVANPQDIFIPKQFINGAVDGDLVDVELFEIQRSEKGPEGKIEQVIKRGREHAAGIVNKLLDETLCFAYVPILGANKLAQVRLSGDYLPKVGDRIILKIEEWGNKDLPTVASFATYLGHISDPSIDVEAAAEEFDLKTAFPKEAIKEAKAFGVKVEPKEHALRLNLTKQICFTIDPTTAKDYDDALHVSCDKKGNYFLAVHIADVAHYVPSNSFLDKEAKERCNSTYFPGKCIPMLPEELSNELCSLKPSVERLTVSVLMHFDPEGNLLRHEIKRTIIKSRKRFTYEEAKEVLDGTKSSRYLPMLKNMVKLCDLLKAKRRERGSVDFSLPELVIEVDNRGVPKGTKVVDYDITHQLVEEFMLKANEVVATELDARGKALLFRIHEEPNAENSSDFYQLARSLGFNIPENPSQQEVQKLFEEIKLSPFAQQLTVAFIRSMRLAYYSTENVGHFGLALSHYTHFTSPIRRYSDLIIQRLLFDEEISFEEIKKIALDCSEQERLSFKAESSVKTLKKLRLLQSWKKEDPSRTYPAYVTKIKPFGFFFEVIELGLEGYLHVSELEDDYFLYQERQNRLVGKYRGITYAPSTKIEVVASSIDFIYQEVKWELKVSKGKKRN